jgi:hypothetical protein
MVQDASLFVDDVRVMVSIFEGLCTLTGHRLGPLCGWIVRYDVWWRDAPKASRYHRELRDRFEGAATALPFPALAETKSDDTIESPARRVKSKSA